MDAPQAAERLALLNRVDPLAGYRGALREIAERDQIWAGIPMLLGGSPLTIEPTYPKAAELMAISRSAEDKAAEQEDAGQVLINSFWSDRHRGDILIWREPDGRTDWGITHGVHSLSHQLQTAFAADVWGIEQEARAVQLLGTLLRHRQFKQYLLTGMFMEQSGRSGVHYLFRKLRPTIAIKEGAGHPWKKGRDPHRLIILCALCLHPIGYYSGSWAGAMCPTDDVIAALVLMRGDEVMLWKRANQIPPYRPNAGL